MKRIKETWTNSYPPTKEGKIQKDIIEKALFSTVSSGYSVTGKIDDYIIYIKDLSGKLVYKKLLHNIRYFDTALEKAKEIAAKIEQGKVKSNRPKVFRSKK